MPKINIKTSLTLFTILIFLFFFSLIPNLKVLADFGKVTFVNNLPYYANPDELKGELIVCVNEEAVSGEPVKELSSIYTSGPSGTYSFTVVDTAILNEYDTLLALGWGETDPTTGEQLWFDVFCRNLSIIDSQFILGSGSYILEDDQNTTINIQSTDIDYLNSYFYVYDNVILETTPEPSATILTTEDYYNSICINGILSPSFSIGTWVLNPGTYQIQIPVENYNIDPSG